MIFFHTYEAAADMQLCFSQHHTKNSTTLIPINYALNTKSI